MTVLLEGSCDKRIKTKNDVENHDEVQFRSHLNIFYHIKAQRVFSQICFPLKIYFSKKRNYQTPTIKHQTMRISGYYYLYIGQLIIQYTYKKGSNVFFVTCAINGEGKEKINRNKQVTITARDVRFFVLWASIVSFKKHLILFYLSGVCHVGP